MPIVQKDSTREYDKNMESKFRDFLKFIAKEPGTDWKLQLKRVFPTMDPSHAQSWLQRILRNDPKLDWLSDEQLVTIAKVFPYLEKIILHKRPSVGQQLVGSHIKDVRQMIDRQWKEIRGEGVVEDSTITGNVPEKDVIIGFGKFSGLSVTDAAAKDPEFYGWLGKLAGKKIFSMRRKPDGKYHLFLDPLKLAIATGESFSGKERVWWLDAICESLLK